MSRIEPEFPDNIHASLAHALTLAGQYKDALIEAKAELARLRGPRERSDDTVSITLHGASAQLEAAVEAIVQAKEMHGWAMSQTLGEESRAHRRLWDSLSRVLESAEGSVDLLRIGRKHRCGV
jgi:hypothetical protein